MALMHESTAQGVKECTLTDALQNVDSLDDFPKYNMLPCRSEQMPASVRRRGDVWHRTRLLFEVDFPVMFAKTKLCKHLLMKLPQVSEWAEGTHHPSLGWDPM